MIVIFVIAMIVVITVIAARECGRPMSQLSLWQLGGVFCSVAAEVVGVAVVTVIMIIMVVMIVLVSA